MARPKTALAGRCFVGQRRSLRNLMVDYMARQKDICFGDNAPYSGHLKNDCLYRHGTQKGLPHALIELRQDEIANAAGQGAGLRIWSPS